MRLILLCIVIYWSVPTLGQTFFIKYNFKDQWNERRMPDSVFINASAAKKYIIQLQNNPRGSFNRKLSLNQKPIKII